VGIAGEQEDIPRNKTGINKKTLRMHLTENELLKPFFFILFPNFIL
jgi:hypothetical protein